MASRVKCLEREHMIGWLSELVTDQGAEGLILRRPLSLYEHGRSTNLFKLKVFIYNCYHYFLTFKYLFCCCRRLEATKKLLW